MDSKTNQELFNYYLQLLTLRKEEFLRNYKPNSWEKLTKEEQLQLTKLRTQQENLKELDQRISFNQLLREYREYKKLRRLLRKSKIFS